MNTDKLLKLLFPQKLLGDPEIHLSQKLYVFTSLSVGFVTLFFSISYCAYEMYTIGFAQFIISLTAFLGYISFRRSENYKTPIYVLLFVTWVASIFRVYYMGGISAPTFYTYAIIPVYTGAILSVNAAIFWTLLFCLVPIVFHYLNLNQFEFVSHISPEGLASARIWGIVFANLVVLVVMIVVKNIFQKFRVLVEKERDEKASLLRLVSHDISNPLTVLSISVGHLSHLNKEEESHQKSVRRCENAIYKISQIVENIKRLEAIKSGKLIPARVPTSLFQLKEQVMEYTHPLLLDKKLCLAINVPSQDISFNCDIELVQSQIINNLVSNSIKFSDVESKIEIQFDIIDSQLQIVVIDSGKGIPKKSIGNIFSHNKPTTSIGTQGEKGTGFGLPIVKSVVEVLNGEISVQSQSRDDGFSQCGTQFKVLLPVFLI